MLEFPFKNDNKKTFILMGRCDKCGGWHDERGYYYISVDGNVLCFDCFKDEVETHIDSLGEYTAHPSNKHPDIHKVNKKHAP